MTYGSEPPPADPATRTLDFDDRSDPRFLAVLDEMQALHYRKSHDYGSDEDPLANLRASEDFGVPAWIGAVIRGHDKVIRLKTFISKGKLANESVENALLDLATYALLALILYRERAED